MNREQAKVFFEQNNIRYVLAQFVDIHVTFKNNFGIGGNFEIHRLALHQLNWFLPKKSGDQIFLYIGRRGNDGRKCKRRIGSYGNCNFHFA